MAVMLYLLGLSYGAVVIMLEALGIYLSKTSVFRSVQAAGEAVPGLKRQQLLPGYRTKALGADLTSVKCKGEWLTLGVTVDPLNGWVLSIDDLPAEDAQTLQEWIEPIAEAVGAHTLVTDDADALKTAADDSGLYHQVCKSHVGCNTDELIASLSQAIQGGEIPPWQTYTLKLLRPWPICAGWGNWSILGNPTNRLNSVPCMNAMPRRLVPPKAQAPASPTACATCSSTAGTSGRA
jgi:hypothetical protein